MAKKNFNTMMNEPKKGLDLLIQPTTKPTGANERTTIGSKEKAVHCNFVMSASLHKQLKIIATKKGVALKVVLEEALSAYFERNKDLL